MAYTTRRITAIDPTVLRRLFDDCESKTVENFTALNSLTSDQRFNTLKEAAESWAADGVCLECSKDGTIVFIAWGPVASMNWKLINFLAGKDASGSRSFLYDSAWELAVRDFHISMSSVYTSHEVIHTSGSSAKTHFDTLMDASTGCTASSDTTVDTDFTSRTITGIE